MSREGASALQDTSLLQKGARESSIKIAGKSMAKTGIVSTNVSTMNVLGGITPNDSMLANGGNKDEGTTGSSSRKKQTSGGFAVEPPSLNGGGYHHVSVM